MSVKKDTRIKSDFSEIIISLASPESILERSRGEVTQPETVNYRTYKPEMKGLFCERIFGPTKDWECHCGKYTRIRYRGIVCDRCGVEVTEKKVRRERTGHIELIVPIAHTWYFRSLPSKIGNLLGIPNKKLDQIIYYERYLVVQAGVKAEDGINYLDFITEEEYLDILDSLPRENQLLDDNDPQKFIAKMGAEALEFILCRLDLDNLSLQLREQANIDTSQQRRLEALKRLKVIEAFRDSKKRIVNRPEWMIMRIIPVIPPELRPLVPLDGGKFATADLNDLYRRVIIRNNRLKRLMDIKAPEVILRNEKRMLQEAVDSLFDNSRKVNTVASEGLRPLKSFSDILKGKQGRFRQNLLGKRVDYSGRSVIVVGPDLKLHECGLPKDMAVELFKPFIIRRLIERGVVKTVKAAKKLVDKKTAVVLDVLEHVMHGHPVLLNRAPSLHKLSIQAFQPKLIEGKAIQLHPMVCPAFNADFDGDQMAVHVPLSHEAIAEASLLMLSSHNILNSANGIPLAVPTKDMILGLYYLTKDKKSTPEQPVLGEGMIFYSPQEVILGLKTGKVDVHAAIKVRLKETNPQANEKYQLMETTAGRVLFNQYLPEEYGYINDLLTSKKLQTIVTNLYTLVGTDRVAKFLDDVKTLGFRYAYKSGVSFALNNIKVPAIKHQLIEKAQQEVDTVQENYLMGLITENERYNQIIDIWTQVNTKVTMYLMQELEEDKQGFNAVFMMMHSGARGSREQVRQLGGMRGLMTKPQKNLQGSSYDVIENPICSNFLEGLDALEYFISAHGARKGLTDTALKTADAGYLTRRLVDVAQDLIITEEDCNTFRGLTLSTSVNSEEVAESISDQILGRVNLYDVYDPNTHELLVPAGREFDEKLAALVEARGIQTVTVRSVLTCETKRGVCAKCYGRNLSTNKMVQMGEAIGVIAAQSIGEPGTQLTLKTFHVGGAVSNTSVDATIKAKETGVVKFEDLNTVPTTTPNEETLQVVLNRSCEMQLVDKKDAKKVLMRKHIPYGAFLRVEEGQLVERGQEICYWDPYNAVILTGLDGTISFQAIEEGVTYKEEYDEQTGYKEKVIIESKDKTKNPSITVTNAAGEAISYNIPLKARLVVQDGATIKKGSPLVKIPRIVNLSKDITGGLPRVTSLFEAREPSNACIISEIDGFVSYGAVKRGNREIFVESKDGLQRKYMVPLSKHILVQSNDYIKAGYPISDGNVSPSSILHVKGFVAVQEYLIKELQAVYRLQGVKINNKHLEVIIKQMLSKLEVLSSGDTTFLPGQTVDKFTFREENDKLLHRYIVTALGGSKVFRLGQFVTEKTLQEENKSLKKQNLPIVEARAATPAIARLKLQGITRASLDTHSFISAASFQDTTRVLSEAAIQGKRDPLQGLKENVIVGHLIPTGTGLPAYRSLIVGSQAEYDKLMALEESTSNTIKALG